MRSKLSENLEWLVVRVGLYISYDPQTEQFVVETGDGGRYSNVDMEEAIDVAKHFTEAE